MYRIICVIHSSSKLHHRREVTQTIIFCFACTHLANPGRHGVCARWTVVCVDNNDSDDDGGNDEDHGKEQVFPNERDSAWGRRDEFHDHK